MKKNAQMVGPGKEQMVVGLRVLPCFMAPIYLL